LKRDRLRGKTKEDIKWVCGNNIREVRDNSNAVLDIGGFICRSVSGWGSMRKSRGRLRI
jgi:hypothetical protein